MYVHLDKFYVSLLVSFTKNMTENKRIDFTGTLLSAHL